MLLDDETVPYVVGECLVHLPREEVEEKLQQGGPQLAFVEANLDDAVCFCSLPACV
jgi:hypothetical protein